jgi:hypothetical protein
MNEITLQTIPSVIEELEKAYFDIPFENSDFQNRNFVVAAQLTPERAYRAIGLRMSAKIRALKEAMYGRELEDIDIEEMREQLQSEEVDKYEKRRIEVKIAQKLDTRNYTDKLINDALRECNVLYSEFKKHPNYTREEFEAGEEVHFTEHLLRQVNGCVGARESLANMQHDYKSIESTLQLEAQLNAPS